MTVSVSNTRETLTGAALGSWTPAFPVFSATNVVAYLIDTSVTPNTAVLLTKDTDYSITLTTPDTLPSLFTMAVLNGGGRFPSLVLGASKEIRINRETAATQDRTFSTGDAFPEEDVELALDKTVVIGQEASDLSQRSMHAHPSDAATLSLQLPAASTRAGKFLAFDATGNVISSAGTLTGITATAFWSSIISSISSGEPSLEALGMEIGTTASRPGSGDYSGALHISTDDLKISQWDGSAWQENHLRLSAGVSGSKPAHGAFGIGFYFETNTGKLQYSDGATAWFDVGVEQFARASFPGSPVAGRILVDTDRDQIYRGNGTSTPDILRGAERGFINGLNLAWVSTTSMQLKVGAARDSTDVVTGRLAAAQTKSLATGAWASGAGNMQQNGGSITTGWHHVFLLIQPNGTVDWGIDTSTTATTLKGGAASAYTLHRRVGSVFINSSSQIERFIQSGDEFAWYNPTASQFGVDANALTTSPATYTVMVPPDYSVLARISFSGEGSGANERSVRVYSPDQSDLAIDDTSGNCAVANGYLGKDRSGFQVSVLTNTARQVRAVTDGALSKGTIEAYGWLDNRSENWS